MKRVRPIRDKDKIEELKDYMKDWSPRNFLLLILGLNTGLRIGDIIPLKLKDFEGEHIIIKEQKTGKAKEFFINDTVRKEVNKYAKLKNLKPYDYLFESRKKCKKKGHEGEKQHISREQAWRILNKAAKAIGLQYIGTHSMRKTFGYHMYKMEPDVALLMDIFNHSSPDITLVYIGINQEEKDNKTAKFSL